ncbi:MAG: hypothetical protein KGL39_01660 [Patescibacteria group bacterium]|nr:hypothetical protein [Patescibacteria group bacterium]
MSRAKAKTEKPTATPALSHEALKFTGDLCKEAVNVFTLARIEDLQGECKATGEAVMFDPSEALKDGRVWDSVERHVNPPNRDEKVPVKKPINMSANATVAVASVVAAVCTLVKKTRSVDSIENLAASDHEEAAIISAASAVTDAMMPHPDMKTDGMSKDYGFDRRISERLNKMIPKEIVGDDKSVLDPLSRMCLNFIKCVGWFTGNEAWEADGVTFNPKCIYLVVRNMGAHDPSKNTGPLLAYMKRTVDEFAAVADRKKEEKKAKKAAAGSKKASPKKASPKKASPNKASPKKAAAKKKAAPKKVASKKTEAKRAAPKKPAEDPEPEEDAEQAEAPAEDATEEMPEEAEVPAEEAPEEAPEEATE